MVFDNTNEADYIIKMLNKRRDKIHRQMYELETIHKDHVALHNSPVFQKHTAELNLNATLTVRAMNDFIQIRKEETIQSN